MEIFPRGFVGDQVILNGFPAGMIAPSTFGCPKGSKPTVGSCADAYTTRKAIAVGKQRNLISAQNVRKWSRSNSKAKSSAKPTQRKIEEIMKN